jgi:hypothetical protein
LALILTLAGVGALVLIGGVVGLVLLLNNSSKDKSSKESGLGNPLGPLGKGNGQGWKADEKFLTQLAPESNVQGYRIRPPQGYTLSTRFAMGGQVHTWAGPRHPDFTQPQFLLLVLPIPAHERNVSLRTQFDQFLIGFKRSFGARVGSGDLRTTSQEEGQVDGVDFIRCDLSATGANQKKIAGFCYLGKHNNNVIAITFVDVEPFSASSVPVAHASVLTLKKP